MSNKKNKYSVSKVLNQNGTIVGYLSTRDEENGLDIAYDLKGYKIVALWQRKKGENIMEKAELYEIVETMTEQLGADVLLENLVMAMNYDELKANLEFIDRMHDLENFWIAPLP